MKLLWQVVLILFSYTVSLYPICVAAAVAAKIWFLSNGYS